MRAARKNECPVAAGQVVKTISNHAADFTPEQQVANVTAQLALAGHQVHSLESGFLVSRWGMTKVCPDFTSLAQFAKQVGVKL